jgi:outer membrane cobalamin receptor
MAFATFSSAAAQNPPAAPGVAPARRGEIRGLVVDNAGQTPLAMASVDVMESGAMTTIASVVTDADGTFRIRNLRPARYRVRIRAIGYKPREILRAEISATAPTIDVGTVALTAAPIEMQSLGVTEQQPEVQLAPDRNTYVVRDMPTTKGGTALDVLRNVPSVDVDIDNIVSLRGNSGVVVQLNGRASPMTPTQLGNFLGQLPADIVDKVEVVPNPSAREDPEGVAGIINIVMKRRADAGRSGGLTIGGGTTGHADIGGNLGYQNGPLSLFGSYGFLRDDRPRDDSIFRENLYTSPVTYLDESAARSQIPVVHTLTGTAGYKLGPHDELSADLLGTTRIEYEGYSVLYRNLDASQALTGLSDRSTTDRNYESTFLSTLGYKHIFADTQHRLSGEFRVSLHPEGGPATVVARDLAPSMTPTDTSALEFNNGHQRPRETSARVDYVRPLSGKLRLQTGYAGSLRQFHTTLQTDVFDAAQAAYVPDSTRISDFTYDQLVHAAYGMLDAQAGKMLLEGGIRVEEASTRFHLQTTGATYHNPYNSVFPSGLAAWNFNELNQLKLSYSTRIRRPDDTDLLDPTPHYQDPLNLSIGNPYLRPEYIHAVELGFQRTSGRATIQITPFFRHSVDAVRQIRTIDTTGVTTRTFANIARSDAWGTDATLAVSGAPLSGFVSASAFHQESDAANVAPGLTASSFGWSVRTNLAYRPSRTLDFQALISYQAPMTDVQGKNASRTRVSLAGRKKLRGDQMSLTLRLIDPFNTSREINTTIDPQFTQVTDRRRQIRGLLLSVNWSFGRPQRHGRDDLIGNDTGTP